MMKLISVVCILFMMTGCLTGRSWDTPGQKITQNNLPNLPQFTLYVDGEIDLIRGALNEFSPDHIELKIAEKKEDKYISYPVINVKIQVPEWKNSWLTNASVMLSGLTISIIPGYMYQSSNITFQLAIPNQSGALVTSDYTYFAKRHYVSWLPLWIVGNFTQTIQTWHEPQLDWYTGTRRIIRQFFRDASPRFGEYQVWLDKQAKL